MKHIKMSLLASCLIANLSVVAFAQAPTTETSSNTETKTTEQKSKHCGLRKHRLRKLFKKSTKTESTTTK